MTIWVVIVAVGAGDFLLQVEPLLLSDGACSRRLPTARSATPASPPSRA